MKKALSIMIALCIMASLTISALPAVAEVSDTFTAASGPITFGYTVLTEDPATATGTVSLTGSPASIANSVIVIPGQVSREVGGVKYTYAVTEIGENAFDADFHNNNGSTIRLPDTLRVIRNGAFKMISAKDNIMIPAGVTEIGQEAFEAANAAGGAYCFLGDKPKLGTSAFFATAGSGTSPIYYKADNATWLGTSLIDGRSVSGKANFLSSVSIDNTSPEVGDTVTISPMPAGATYTVRWLRVLSKATTTIEFADADSYIVTSEDVGASIVAVVNGTGEWTGTAVSDYTAAVTTTSAIDITNKTISFANVVEGYSEAPAGQTVTVSVGGTGSVTLLPIESDEYVIGAFSPSATTNAGSTVSFTIRPKAGLAAGNYSRLLRVWTTAGDSASLRVDFTVEPTVYRLKASTTRYQFSNRSVGYTEAISGTVTFENTGNMPITLDPLQQLQSFVVGTMSSNTIQPGGTATVTATVKGGLAMGSYLEALSVTGSGGVSVSVEFGIAIVGRVKAYGYGSNYLDFGIVLPGYTQTSTETVMVENTSNQSVTVNMPSSVSFDITGFPSNSTIAAGGKLSFQVRPKLGLGVGNHSERLTISESGGTNTSIGVEFEVKGAEQSAIFINSSPLSDELNFGTAVEGYSVTDVKLPYMGFFVFGVGNKAITVNLPVLEYFDVVKTHYSGEANSYDMVIDPDGEDSVQLYITPKPGLKAGTYFETMVITGSNDTSDSIKLAFTVTPINVGIRSDRTQIDFGTAPEGHANLFPNQSIVTVTNSGNTPITIGRPTLSDSYIISGYSPAEIAPGGSTQLRVQPKTNLAVGVYNSELVVTSSKGSTLKVPVRFEVKSGEPKLVLIPDSADFSSAVEGYTGIAEKTITVKNEGLSSIALSDLPSLADYTITSYASGTVLVPSGAVTFKIKPKDGLGVGRHDTVLSVSEEGGTSASLKLSFEVEAKSYDFSIAQIEVDFGTHYEGYSGLSSITIVIRNTGNQSMTFTNPSAANFTVGSLSATTLAPGAVSTFTVAPAVGLKGGSYSVDLVVANDHEVERRVALVFNVISAPVIDGALSFPELTSGSYYDVKLKLLSGSESVWALAEGSVLPDGLVINSGLGTLSGTTTAAAVPGSYTFDLAARNAAGSDIKTFVIRIVPRVTAGDKQSIKPSDGGSLTVTSDAAFADYLSTAVDGKPVPAAYLAVVEGSTKVTLSNAFLATLAAGKHTIEIVSKSGTAAATFTVLASPATGDNSALIVFTAISSISGVCLLVVVLLLIRKKHAAKLNNN